MCYSKTYLITLFTLLGMAALVSGQINPQFTQYTINTMTVNAGYTGSREALTAIALHRSQWSGIEGAPRTLTFSIDAPTRSFNGLGLSIIHDESGPAQETYLDGNYAHTLFLNNRGLRLGLGLKAGARMLSIDWSRGIFRDPDTVFNENVNSELLFTIGSGLFMYNEKAYIGLSVPNFLPNKHYDEIQESAAQDRMHYYLIGGYVFQLNENIKFKPSFYMKQVAGGALSVDTSANFLLIESLNVGINYRWNESISGILGFQISPRMRIGYSYDYSTGELNNYNSGSHEFFVRYQVLSDITAIKSPRFF